LQEWFGVVFVGGRGCVVPVLAGFAGISSISG
jgi:hypothetical protein